MCHKELCKVSKVSSSATQSLAAKMQERRKHEGLPVARPSRESWVDAASYDTLLLQKSESGNVPRIVRHQPRPTWRTLVSGLEGV